MLGHDLFRKPVPSPDQVWARLFRDHALVRQGCRCRTSESTEPARRRACLSRDPAKIRHYGADARLTASDVTRRTAWLRMQAELAGKNLGFRHVARGNRQARRSANRLA